MSAFTGIFFRDSAGQQEQRIRDLRVALHAYSQGQAHTETRCPNTALWKFDFDAFLSPGLLVEPGQGVTVVAGHPLATPVLGCKRIEHVRWLNNLLPHERLSDNLRQARGSYAFAHIPWDGCSLFLGSDCLAVRPLYYASNDQYVIFSTQLQTFEHLAEFDLSLDARGAIEMATFGFCTGDRTRYAHVKSIRAGRFVVFDKRQAVTTQYWRWDDTTLNAIQDDGASQRRIFDCFQEAIRIRLDNERRVMAFLTGGLDSRVVVASLRAQQVEVNSANFAAQRSMDLELGRQIAFALGTNHLELPMLQASVAGKIATVMTRWLEHTQSEQLLSERPRLIWSGDGGSVALGHVYLSAEVAALAERGDVEGSLRLLACLNTWQVPKGVLPSGVAEEFATYPCLGLSEELAEIHHRDAARRLHILTMVTDQRGHLYDHYERIYQHRCELQLPFFDRAFLQTILSQPGRPFFRHVFYNNWLRLFAPQVRDVPWQPYPGHEPGPTPIPPGLTSQWERNAITKDQARKERQCLAQQILRDVVRGYYSNGIVDRSKLILACALTRFGIRDYVYALRFAQDLRSTLIR